MPQFTINIPTAAAATRLINALCDVYGYRAKIVQDPSVFPPAYIDNPESKADFARRIVTEFLKSALRTSEQKTIEEQARANGELLKRDIDDIGLTTQ